MIFSLPFVSSCGKALKRDGEEINFPFPDLETSIYLAEYESIVTFENGSWTFKNNVILRSSDDFEFFLCKMKVFPRSSLKTLEIYPGGKYFIGKNDFFQVVTTMHLCRSCRSCTTESILDTFDRSSQVTREVNKSGSSVTFPKKVKLRFDHILTFSSCEIPVVIE